MENVFLQLLNMSITAGWLVLAVLVLRLVLRNAPRWIHCLLWVLVAVRLIFPISIESVFSLIPSAQPVDAILSDTPFVGGSAPVTDTPAAPVAPITPSAPVVSTPDVAPQAAAPTVTEILTLVWVVGLAALLLYAAIATIRLRLQVRESVRLRDNVWQCDRIATPFILGVFRPRIYLPSGLSGQDTHSVVSHEQAHLKRHDHWWKPLGFLLLAVYWFNPLMWVAYVLLCRDIEAACDEKVIQGMDVSQRKSYSESLLACSAPRHLVTACPLAFGETAVKSRVKTVLNYKKPAFWLVLVAVVALVVSSVCLLTNPKSTVAEEPDEDAAEETFEPTTARFIFDSMTWMTQEDIDENNLPVTVIRSVEELNAFIEKYDAEMGFTKNFSTGTGPASQMLEAYTEEYFQKKAVLAVYYKTGSSSVDPKVIGINYSDRVQVLVDVYEPYLQEQALGQWFMMVGVKQEEITKASSVTARVRGHVATDVYAAAFEQEMKYTDKARELWRERLNNEEQEYLWAMLNRLAWGEKGLKGEASTFVGVFNLNGGTYYVSSAYDIVCTEDKIAYLTAQDSEYLRSMYQPRGAVTHVTPYQRDDPADVELPTKAPEKNYWQTLSHPMPYNEAVKVTGGYKLDKWYVEKLQNFVKSVEWRSDNAPTDTAVFDAYFTLDGVTKYYVSVEKWGESGYLYNGTEYANLTKEQASELDFMMADCGTMKGTHYLSGYFAEWNKAERYFVLDVVWADDAALIGKKIRVNTKNLLGRGLPYIGTMLEVSYDGTVIDDMVYATYCNEQDKNAFSNIGDPYAGGTFTGKVIHVADGAVLMNCYDKDQFDTVWVRYGDNYPDLKPQMSEEYQVVFDGQTMETYPPQVTAETMTQVSSTPLNNGFISEERAIEIAVERWKVQLGVPDRENGYYTTVYVMEMPTAENPRYKIGSREVNVEDGEPQNSALFYTMEIDAVTGEVLADSYMP